MALGAFGIGTITGKEGENYYSLVTLIINAGSSVFDLLSLNWSNISIVILSLPNLPLRPFWTSKGVHVVTIFDIEAPKTPPKGRVIGFGPTPSLSR